MDFHYQLLRITTESIVDRVLRDIQNDADRSIRKSIDLGRVFAKGELQKEFFQLASDAAASPRNLYNRLIKRGVHTVDNAIFKTIGVNLGITSFTYGVSQIRAQYKKTGQALTWLQELNDFHADSDIQEDMLETRIKNCFEGGAYAFLIRLDTSREAFRQTIQTAAKHRECTFILCVESGLIGEAEASNLLAVKNIIVLIHIEHTDSAAERQKKAEAFRVLRQRHLLYGFLFYYGNGIAADLSDDFLEDMIACGCLTGVFVHTGQDNPEEQHPVYQFICSSRKQGPHPILLFDYQQDMDFIQDLILWKRRFSPEDSIDTGLHDTDSR